MKRPRHHSRPVRRRHFIAPEALESRVMLTSTLLPLTDHKDMVVDASRNQLIVVGNAGTVYRYDLLTGNTLAPVDLGITPGGSDISADGQYLYVPVAAASTSLTVERLDLNSLTVDLYTTSVSPSAGLFDAAALADGTVELTTIAPGQAQVFAKLNEANQSIVLEPALNTNVQIHSAASIYRSADRTAALFVEPQNNSPLFTLHDIGGVRFFQPASNFERQLSSGGLSIAATSTGALNRNGTLYALDLPTGVELFNQSGSLVTTLVNIHGGLSFSPVADRLYVADPYVDAVRIFDVSDPFQPLLLTQLALGEDLTDVGVFSFSASTNGQIAVSPDDSRLFVTTTSGIRMLDQPAHAWHTALGISVPFMAQVGDTITLTASVAADDEDATTSPTGLVTFYESFGGLSNSRIGSPAPLVNGAASTGAGFLTTGQHPVFFTYGGDENFSYAVLGATQAITVIKGDPALGLSIGENSNATILPGQNFNFHVVVTIGNTDSAALSGTVTFWNETTNAAIGSEDLSLGNASVALPGLPEGDYLLRADFSGNSVLNAGSAHLTLHVEKGATTLAFEPPAEESDTLTVHLASPAGQTFTGTVTLLEDGAPLMTSPVVSAQALFELGSLASGPHVFTASYSGDSLFEAATSEAFAQTVPISTSTFLDATPSAASIGHLIELTARVTAGIAGTVTFKEGNTVLGTSPVENGEASWIVLAAATGAHYYTARFDPDAAGYLHKSDAATVTVYQPTVLDLLAFYTREELAAAGSIEAVLTQVQQQVADTNRVMANSLIPVSVRLVGLSPANYNEAGNLATDWKRLSNPSDGYMDQVAALRTRLGADLVVLLDAQSSAGSSSNTELQGEASVLTLSIFGTSYQSQAAFLVISEEASPFEYVLAHEIGHTMGAAHAAGDPGGNGIDPIAHGYRFTGTNGVTYHDVMSYDPGQTIPYYSNPTIFHQGVAIGDAATADVARLIRYTALSASNYRKAVPFGAITSGDASSISGWVLDPKILTEGSTIRIDIDGVTRATLRADDERPDLLSLYGAGGHGFTWALPHLGAGNHKVTVYAIDAASGLAVSIATKTVTANHFVWTQQPVATVVAGQTASSLTIAVKNAANQVVTGYQATLTLSVASGPAGGTMNGTLTAAVINGVATFDGITFPKAGSYTLNVSDGSLTAKSNGFTVKPDVATGHLVLTPPASAGTIVGKPLVPFVVSLQDQFGNLVTTDHSKVALSIVSGPSGGTLAGTILVGLSNGVAKFSNVIPTKAGDYTLAASDALIAITTPVEVSQTAFQGVTTVAAPKPAAAYLFQQAITLSTTLKATSPSSVPFTGSATLMDQDDNVLGSAVVAPGGAVKFIFSAPYPGDYQVRVKYPGDVNHTAASSSTFTLAVHAAKTTTGLAGSAATLVFGQPLTLTAAIGSALSADWVLGGQVDFYDGVTLLSSVPLFGDRTASLTLTPGTLGTHNYKAVYSGDGSAAGSVSSVLKRSVGKVKTTISLAPSNAGPVSSGQPLDLSVHVAVVAPGQSSLTGNLVTFKDGSKVLGTLPLDSDGNATLAAMAFTTSGTHSLTAIFAGDLEANAAASLVVKLAVV